ncbi:BCE_3a_G0033880.mRNA.1.CDS.1 [Saccharomyces cerevisiae]|nr:BCE_3a_G0033880.mRNA.1.CDS.1 [Saccharomyces cerevisiae]CAI7213376.1 BCE_3a_G0033880.mRNA.1.CDS.1 [Saccharomyces cerevisiae]
MQTMGGEHLLLSQLKGSFLSPTFGILFQGQKSLLRTLLPPACCYTWCHHYCHCHCYRFNSGACKVQSSGVGLFSHRSLYSVL